ncbi:MAG TPA: MBL fold metallo-hydrolase [Ramlibacter sp.]|nr:MBL fold metallo-hydrolase [Ramlibacter sp.]
MIHSRRIGDALVHNIVEYIGPTHAPEFIFPNLQPRQLEEHVHWLAPHQYVPSMRRFVIAMQLWVVHVDGCVVVIDTGVGNHRPRPRLPRMHMLNTLTPLWLEAAGATADTVTHVLTTHFHGDHLGWNTHLVDGRWVPMFLKARYLMPRADFELARAEYDGGNRAALSGAYEEAVLPVFQAGLVDFLEAEQQVACGCFGVERMPGHTPGSLHYRLRSGGQEGVFCGDVMHSPLQVHLPEVDTWIDHTPQQARASRRLFLERAADSGSLVMPTHFGFPHCGYVRRDGSGFRWEPERR